jgi:hypothetical protein
MSRVRKSADARACGGGLLASADGVRYFHGCYSVGDDTLSGVSTTSAKTPTTASPRPLVDGTEQGRKSKSSTETRKPGDFTSRKRRWAVERNIGWTTTYRSLARDYKTTPT